MPDRLFITARPHRSLQIRRARSLDQSGACFGAASLRNNQSRYCAEFAVGASNIGKASDVEFPAIGTENLVDKINSYIKIEKNTCRLVRKVAMSFLCAKYYLAKSASLGRWLASEPRALGRSANEVFQVRRQRHILLKVDANALDLCGQRNRYSTTAICMRNAADDCFGLPGRPVRIRSEGAGRDLKLLERLLSTDARRAELCLSTGDRLCNVPSPFWEELIGYDPGEGGFRGKIRADQSQKHGRVE